MIEQAIEVTMDHRFESFNFPVWQHGFTPENRTTVGFGAGTDAFEHPCRPG